MPNPVLQTFGANMPCEKEIRKFKSEREMRTYFRIHIKRCLRCKHAQLAIYESEDLHMKSSDYDRLIANNNVRVNELAVEAEANRPYLRY